MKRCSAIGLLTLWGIATANEPNLDGLSATQIEKIMLEALAAPPGSGSGLNFTKTVKPIMDNFKKTLKDEKNKMQKNLNEHRNEIYKCIRTMYKVAYAGLLEVDKKECPPDWKVDKCKRKLKKLEKGKSAACKELEKTAEDDLKGILDLVKEWNKKKITKKDCKLEKDETKWHYANRLHYHFEKKYTSFHNVLEEKMKKVTGKKKLDEKCDLVKHYTRRMKTRTCRELVTANYACSCDKVIREKEMCAIFDGCYETAKAAYIALMKETRKKNAAAKLEWRAVGRIECLVQVMGGKTKRPDASKLNRCVTGPSISTRPLDLWYGGIPGKPSCWRMRGVNWHMRRKCKTKKADKEARHAAKVV